MLKFAIKRSAFVIAGAGLLTIWGCGSGGTNTALDMPVTVIDGPIGNATVCLDKNDNGVCDSGEPAGRTDLAGKATLRIESSDAGKYPVVAMVGTDAVDADTGPVPIAYTLRAPADQTGVVTPLTTLVQNMVASAGLTSAAAEHLVKEQTGIDVSLFEDFSKGTTDAHKTAAMVARLLVLTTQQQSAAIAGAVGTTAIDGITITPADLDRAIENRMAEVLPALLAAVAEPAVQAAATGAAREAELLKRAQLLADPAHGGLTTAAVSTQVAINRRIANGNAAASADPTASASLSRLTFRSAADWSVQVMSSSVAQNTPAADGSRRYREMLAAQVQGGTPLTWAPDVSSTGGGILHWNGSAWTNCPINFENSRSARDANGKSAFNYCDWWETGVSGGVAVDVQGRRMIDVYNEIIAAGYTNLNITAATSVLGPATFPAGSRLTYGKGVTFTSAMMFYSGLGNTVRQYSAAVAAGGIASTQAAGFGCNSTEFLLRGTPSTTLEGMVGALTGTPCIFGQGSFEYLGTTYTSPDAIDEAWDNSTAYIGTIGNIGAAPFDPGTVPGYYTGRRQVRVAFTGAGNSPVTYYACQERFLGLSSRNCVAIGVGSYSIAALGDARVMTLNTVPPEVSSLPFVPVFVERANLVHFGVQKKPRVSRSAQLNLTGLNALFGTLALPAVDPDSPLVESDGDGGGIIRR